MQSLRESTIVVTPVQRPRRSVSAPIGIFVVAFALVVTSGCPGPAAYYQADGRNVPAWGFGLSDPRVLLTFRKYDTPKAPQWCKSTDDLLTTLTTTINQDGNCSAEVHEWPKSGRFLRIECPIGDVGTTCQDVYLGLVWANKHDDAPGNYSLYGVAWVRRNCANSTDEFTPPQKVRDRASKSSKALDDLLAACR